VERACGANQNPVYARISCRGPLERRPEIRRHGRRSSGRRACPAPGRDGEALARGGGHIDGRVGGRREIARNGRTRRTIGRLCCSIARNAGVRYAPLVFGGHRFVARRLGNANEGPSTFRSRGPRHRRCRRQDGVYLRRSTCRARERKNKSNKQHTSRGRDLRGPDFDRIGIVTKIAVRLWIQGMDTERRGVGIGVTRG
jgi:hypothetical protein